MSYGDVVKWDELNELISTNSILHLRRSAEVLQVYNNYKKDLIAKNESLFSHLIFRQLQWAKEEDFKDLISSGHIDDLPNIINIQPTDPLLLAHKDDIKILINDFPYHFEDNVLHLVVWTKVFIKSDPESEMGDISSKTRAIIQRYVQRTFIEYLGIPQDKVVWFRNWSALQSVRNISHLHVIVKDLPKDKLELINRKSGVPLDVKGRDSDLDFSEYV